MDRAFKVLRRIGQSSRLGIGDSGKILSLALLELISKAFEDFEGRRNNCEPRSPNRRPISINHCCPVQSRPTSARPQRPRKFDRIHREPLSGPSPYLCPSEKAIDALVGVQMLSPTDSNSAASPCSVPSCWLSEADAWREASSPCAMLRFRSIKVATFSIVGSVIRPMV